MTYDVPSLGRRARDPGWKTGRLHHHLSDYETYYFYLLEWSDSVIDIKEQFPLLELETVQSIAFAMGVKYPIQVGTHLTMGRITRVFQRIKTDAEITKNLRLYDLRHSTESFLLQVNVNPKVVSESLDIRQ